MLSPDPKARPSMASVVQSLSTLLDETTTAPTPVAVPAASVLFGNGTTPESAEDVATERIEDVATERIEDITTEGVEDVPTERIEEPPPIPTTIPLQDVEAETVAIDQPTRYEPPTAPTEKLGASAARHPAPAKEGSEHIPPPKSARPPERPGRPRRRTGVIAGILVLIGAFVLGAILLFNPLRPTPDDAAEPATSDTPATASATETPGSQAASPSPAPAPSLTPPTATQAPEQPTPEQQAVNTVTDYYAMLPGNLDGAWPLMTADYQENHAGGRRAYEAFWSEIADVEIADVSASAPGRAQATLTYHYRDGRDVREVTAYQLVDEGGVLKIAATDVLSSAEL
jgi:hypothetical protein